MEYLTPSGKGSEQIGYFEEQARGKVWPSLSPHKNARKKQVKIVPPGKISHDAMRTCPANCLLSGDTLRLLDFEYASFRHALLDVAALRFPFPACGCWSRLPEDVGRRAENAYSKEMAGSCPDILDHASYAHGLTVACAAWTIVRMIRLPKMEQVDEPHPMGFSRRGQLLDTISTTKSLSHQSHTLRSFASWLASVNDALRRRWSHITATQPLYPAFQLRNSPT